MSIRALAGPLFGLTLLFPSASSGAGPAQQTPPPIRLVAFTNEPREPEFGEVFELYLQLRMAPDLVAFIPDTLLPAPDAFNAGRGRWTTEPGPADSIDVRATYYVMGVMNGGVELPTLEVFMRPAAPGESPGPRRAVELTAAPEANVGITSTVLEIGGVLVLVPAEMAGEGAAIDPRPPADVLGGDWSPWLIGAVAVGVVAALLLVGIVIAWKRSAPPPMPVVGVSSRAEALQELERLLSLGWHRDGRIDEFYDATTRVLRQLSEREEPDWRLALTSSELVAQIEGRFGAGLVEKLRPAVWSAERVKFGTHRPSAGTAEQDWTVIRDWIRALPEA
jgi:hypothetical protein